MISVTPARATDLAPAAMILAEAFAQDPVMAAVVPGTRRRHERLTDLFHGLLASGPYATGTVDLARDARTIDAVEASLTAVRDALAQSDDLRRLTASPLVARGGDGAGDVGDLPFVVCWRSHQGERHAPTSRRRSRRRRGSPPWWPARRCPR